MRFILPALLLVFLAGTGCKKAIEKKKEDLIVQAMTDGQWKVTQFAVDGADQTADFANYAFQYYENRTVDAILSGSVQKTGNWQEDVNAMSISATFSDASNPLVLINGNWHIDNNSWTFVEASQVVGSSTRTMRLDKL